MYSKLAVACGGFVALVIGFVTLQTNLPLPVELSQTAAGGAINGAGCEKNSNVTVSGGSVSGGETEASYRQKKTCTPMSCHQTVDGKTVCIVKPAAQALAGSGNSGLLGQIGQMLQQMMGGDGGGGGSPIDYQYGTKPECSGFIASSGNQPIEAGASIFLTWVRTGGEVENASLAPAVAASGLESPFEMKAPPKSTTYTLTLSNRSGTSTCSTRVFIGPKGSSITDPEDLAYLAAHKDTSTTDDQGTPSQSISSLCKKTGYSDLDADCVMREKARQEIVQKAAAQEDVAARALLKRSDASITANGVTEAAYTDPRAFTVDPNAFIEDPNAFGSDTPREARINARGEDLDALEARMRALMPGKNRGPGYPTNIAPTSTDVHVTGGLGEMRSDDYGIGRGQPAAQKGVFNTIGSWVRGVFCFWCVAPGTQGGAALLAVGDTPPPSTPPKKVEADSIKDVKDQKADDSLYKSGATGEALTADCKTKNEGKKQQICSVIKDPAKKAQCNKEFDTYVHPESIIPYEKDEQDPKNYNAEIDQCGKIIPAAVDACKKGVKARYDSLKESRCIKVSEAENECVKKCQVKGYAYVPEKALTNGKVEGSLKDLMCKNVKNKRYACRQQTEVANFEKNVAKDDGSGNPGSAASGGGPQSNFTDSAMGQGMGEGMGKSMMDQLGKLAQDGGQGGGQDACSSGGAQNNPKCNPTLPTAAPSCGNVSVSSVIAGARPGSFEHSGAVAQETGGSTKTNSWLGSIKSYFWGDSNGDRTASERTKTVRQGGLLADDALSVTPSVIPQGATATLSWLVQGKGKIATVVSYVTTDKDGREVKGTLGAGEGTGGSKVVTPERSTTYIIKATNEIGSVTCKPVRLSVRPRTAEDDVVDTTTTSSEAETLLAGQFSLTCDPKEYVLNSGEQPSVSWQGCPKGTESTFGTSTEDGAFATGGSVSGSADVSPRRDATYVVRCRDKYNKELARNSCRIDVISASEKKVETTSKDRPFVDIFVRDGEKDVNVNYGESVRVEWRSQNAASCIIYGPGCARFGRSSTKCFKELGRSGFVTGNIYETSEFVAECRGADRTSMADDKVTITIGSDVAPQTVSNEDVPAAQTTSAGGGASEASLDDLLNI